jgi:hypothetical protein
MGRIDWQCHWLGAFWKEAGKENCHCKQTEINYGRDAKISPQNETPDDESVSIQGIGSRGTIKLGKPRNGFS